MMKNRILSILVFMLLCMLVFAGQAAAADENSNRGLIAVGMGLAVGLSALGTGLAQARIGAAGDAVPAPLNRSGRHGVAFSLALSLISCSSA